MKSYQRTDRLGELIHRELAEIIQHKMRDPRVELVNINKVKVTRDLSLARVYVSTLGDAAKNQEVVAVLNKAASYLRTVMAPAVTARIIPALRFIYDDTQLRGQRIDKLLSDLDISDED